MTRPMKRHATFWILLVAALAAFGQTSQAENAINKLKHSRPFATWDNRSLKRADIDCDDKLDSIVLGSEKGDVVVGIVWGNAKTPPQILSFPVRPDTQNGFCAAPKEIKISSLDCQSDEGPLSGCKPTKGCKAFSLSDDKCDPFNFYWDPDRKTIAWWRM